MFREICQFYMCIYMLHPVYIFPGRPLTRPCASFIIINDIILRKPATEHHPRKYYLAEYSLT